MPTRKISVREPFRQVPELFPRRRDEASALSGLWRYPLCGMTPQARPVTNRGVFGGRQVSQVLRGVLDAEIKSFATVAEHRNGRLLRLDGDETVWGRTRNGFRPQ